VNSVIDHQSVRIEGTSGVFRGSCAWAPF